MEDKTKNGQSKSERAQGDVIPKQDSPSAKEAAHFYKTDSQSGKDAAPKDAPGHYDPSTDINMEATINADDVVRAGGFGARDDLSSPYPIAGDSTDFEASLLDARDYEEPQGEQRRPGLGDFGYNGSLFLVVESPYLKEFGDDSPNIMKRLFLCKRFFALV